MDAVLSGVRCAPLSMAALMGSDDFIKAVENEFEAAKWGRDRSAIVPKYLMHRTQIQWFVNAGLGDLDFMAVLTDADKRLMGNPKARVLIGLDGSTIGFC